MAKKTPPKVRRTIDDYIRGTHLGTGRGSVASKLRRLEYFDRLRYPERWEHPRPRQVNPLFKHPVLRTRQPKQKSKKITWV